MNIRALLCGDLDAPWLVERAGEPRTQAQLLAEARVIAETLQRTQPSASPLRVAIACRSVRTFAPAFLGALTASATILLLPNTQIATLVRAAGTSDYLLHDAEDADGREHGIYLPPLLVRAAQRGAPPSDREVSPQQAAGHPRIVLSTSGTTGQPGESIKDASQLVHETQALLPLFADVACVLSTVPPFHLFGLLFGLLLPLRAGAKIALEPGFFLADIGAAIRAHAVDALVSTPAHLSAMLQAEMPKGIRVFSSGARLPDVLHYALMATHDFRVTDVLGSTETGGMATRTLPLSRWTPLPGVRVSPEEVRSPWCDGGVQSLKDVVELFPDGTFAHAGRRDDVIKVAGKRASLAALEDLVRKVPGVRDVAIWQDTNVPGEPRLRYAIACAPSGGPTKDDLRRAVTQEFDPVFAPRQVAFVEALPREATGKLPREKLAALFTPRSTSYVSELPLECMPDGRVSCTLLSNFIFFEGHFRGLPILPGTVLLDRFVVPAVKLLHPDLDVVVGMKRIRFLKTVTPTQHLAVQVTRTAETRITFDVRGAGGAVASGMLEFRGSQGRSA